jgi:hypothetical protein
MHVGAEGLRDQQDHGEEEQDMEDAKQRHA